MSYAIELTLAEVVANKLTEKKDDELYLEFNGSIGLGGAEKEIVRRAPEGEGIWRIHKDERLKLNASIIQLKKVDKAKMLITIKERDKAGLMKLLPGKAFDFIGEFYVFTRDKAEGVDDLITISTGDCCTDFKPWDKATGLFSVFMNGGNSDYEFIFRLSLQDV